MTSVLTDQFPCSMRTRVWTSALSTTDSQTALQSTASQYIGEWDKGTFIRGTWALSDGSQFKGDFGSQVKIVVPLELAWSCLCNSALVPPLWQ